MWALTCDMRASFFDMYSKPIQLFSHIDFGHRFDIRRCSRLLHLGHVRVFQCQQRLHPVDLSFQRFIEVWSGLPMLYLLIILASLVQPGVGWLLAIMLLFSWTSLVDVVRAEFLRGRHLEYVKAARTLGLGDAGVMFRHILPNAMVATLTFLPFLLCGAVTTLTALDFLGFGLPPDSPSLGELVGQGRDNLQAPWLGLTVFVVLATLLSLLVFIGDAVRDAFDPRT